MVIQDEQWQKLQPFLVGTATHPGVTGRDNRLFIEAVLWVVLNRARWSELPSRFGKRQTAYMRFLRWNRAGIWRQMASQVGDDPDLQSVLNAIAAFGDDYAGRLSRRKLNRKNKALYDSKLPKQTPPPAPDPIKELDKTPGVDTNWVWLLTRK